MVKKISLIAGTLAVCLIATLLLRTALLTPSQEDPVDSPVEIVTVSQQRAVDHLTQAIQFKTVSRVVAATAGQPVKTYVDDQLFTRFHGFLRTTYPQLHKRLQLQKISDYSLLFTWPGRQPELAPIVLMAHQDVVPSPSADRDKWQYPPFSGQLADGFIWGRGSLDDKSSLLAIMEAIEGLLIKGWQPRQTVYLAFGHDEEVGGTGAAEIAANLYRQQIKPAMVLDEGGFVMQGIIPGVGQPVALVGIAEKGYLSVKLTVEGKSGHSSMPPPQTAAGIIAAAVTRLEKDPPPKRFDGATAMLFARVSPHMPFLKRLVFANMWFFEPIVLDILEAKISTNATIRTTQAVTMLNSGYKDNVLPSSAAAVINYRLLPEDSEKQILKHIRETINDERITLTALPFSSEATPISAVDDPHFKALERAVRSVFRDDEAIVAPYLTIGATDARHYTGVSANQYRFLPVKLKSEDISRIHGVNERIGVDDYIRMIQFYTLFLENLNAP
jgi:carboxypeptidase PM20D1